MVWFRKGQVSYHFFAQHVSIFLHWSHIFDVRSEFVGGSLLDIICNVASSSQLFAVDGTGSWIATVDVHLSVKCGGRGDHHEEGRGRKMMATSPTTTD